MEKIGVITKPQGCHGEFRASLDIMDAKVIKNLKVISFNGVNHNVQKVSIREGFVVFQVEDILDRNETEKLRNVPIFADLKIELSDGEMLVKDILNFDILVDGKVLGKLIEVNNYGAGDIFTIKGKSEILFPLVQGIIKNINKDSKTIELDDKIFDEVKVEQ